MVELKPTSLDLLHVQQPFIRRMVEPENHPLQTTPVIHISRKASRKRTGQGDACPNSPARYRG
jgi:hypothetical protein